MFVLTILTAGLVAADQAPAPRVVGELVALETKTGRLFGTVDLPPDPGPWPVVILHAGSGPTDRDGNQALIRNNSLKMLGRALAAEGIAVLRIDKRGVAASARALTKEADVRLDTYVADAVEWASWLRRDRRFTAVGFIGHSEGALIGLVAAKDARFDAFVSLCGPGRRLGDLIREQLKNVGRAQFPQELLDKSNTILTELEAGRTVESPPAELAMLFRPSVQPYLISELRHDPADLVKGLAAPLLIVTGSTDIQVPVADGARLAAARPGALHRTISGMNHVLKPVALTLRIAQIPSYTDPTIALHPELTAVVAGFLKAKLGRK